jgi:hypothetical protein
MSQENSLTSQAAENVAEAEKIEEGPELGEFTGLKKKNKSSKKKVAEQPVEDASSSEVPQPAGQVESREYAYEDVSTLRQSPPLFSSLLIYRSTPY